MGSAYSNRFWKLVCQYRSAIGLLLGIEAVLLVLLLIALWLQPVEPGTRTVLVVDFVLVSMGFLAVSYVLYRCRQRRRVD